MVSFRVSGTQYFLVEVQFDEVNMGHQSKGSWFALSKPCKKPKIGNKWLALRRDG